MRDKPCHVHTGNEGALPFPTDLETNLFQRQLLTGGANEEEKPIGPGGNNFPKSEPPKGRESVPSAAHLDVKSQSSIHALRSKVVSAKGQDLHVSLTA